MDRLLVSGSLLPLALTISAFVLALWINRRSRGHPLANPVLLSVGLVILFLLVTRMPYQRYFEGAQLIHFLLGPATVALAVPLFRHWDKVRKAAVPILAGVAAGSATGVLSVAVVAWALRMDDAVTASLATKSITAPVAMGIAEHIGGVPSLAAVFAVLAGMTGAAFGPVLLDRLGMLDSMERGLAMGTASHGQGTARIIQDSEEAGAFSGLAMGLTALIMAVVMPLVAGLFL
jgi:predicted murein hydrolase (TIGR00659 family)